MFNQKSHLFLSRQTRARAARGCQANVCAGPATRSCRQRPHVPRAAPGRARRRRLLRPETRASRRRGDQRCQSPQPAARASPTALEGAAGGGAARSPRRCLRAPDSPGARGNGAAESSQRTPTPPHAHGRSTVSHSHTPVCTHSTRPRTGTRCRPHVHSTHACTTHIRTPMFTHAGTHLRIHAHLCALMHASHIHTLHMHTRTSTQR